MCQTVPGTGLQGRKKDKFGKRWGECPGSQLSLSISLFDGGSEQHSLPRSQDQVFFNFSWASPVAQW